ncbi:hypothetical protein [Streptomyces hydrogenans]|uniref:hypothetical protein n=1 Tax=Streptomyces hydrogenans TaxID=1873719 RepID=UPI0021F5057F|nr:hypothetical protein [Streptomyces hydrogenans]
MSVFGTPDRLAGFGGVAPVPRDSGTISGNLRTPATLSNRRSNASSTPQRCSASDRKRLESRRSTIANAQKASVTPKPSLPSPAAESTSLGPPPRWAVLRTHRRRPPSQLDRRH